MRKPWHPFSETDCRNHLYYRINQGDNCLYTAVSATPAESVVNQRFDFNNNVLTQAARDAFKINTTFPQLEEIPVGDRNQLAIVRTRAGNQTSAQFVVDVVRLYLCRVSLGTAFVDTQWLQGGGSFPELALRGIPTADIKGYIMFVRVHHAAANISGFTAIPVGDKSRLLANPGPDATTLYQAANVQLEAAWGPTGVLAAQISWSGQGYTINRVGAMTVAVNGRIARYNGHGL